jgi:type IV pilus biogenesis protein CpaD/CtpE
MQILTKSRLPLVAAMAVAALVSGCANTPPDQSQLRLSDDFGQAVTQDLAAQITDPDAGLHAGPPPSSDGARAALAQKRYQHNAVVQPSTTGASGQAGGGSGADAGAGAGMSPAAP